MENIRFFESFPLKIVHRRCSLPYSLSFLLVEKYQTQKKNCILTQRMRMKKNVHEKQNERR